jgi:hypothetical protein
MNENQRNGIGKINDFQKTSMKSMKNGMLSICLINAQII